MDLLEKNQFRPLQEISRTVQSGGLSNLVPHRPSTCPSEVAARRAAILLACFRKGDAENPEVYAGAVASVLSCYPEPVAYRVTDPRTGLAGKSQWLPTVAEVRSACEAEMAPSRAHDARVARQAYTDSVLAHPPLKRIAKARFDELSAALEEREQKSGKPTKPFTLNLMAGVDPFADKPLTVSPALKANLAPKEDVQ